MYFIWFFLYLMISRGPVASLSAMGTEPVVFTVSYISSPCKGFIYLFFLNFETGPYQVAALCRLHSDLLLPFLSFLECWGYMLCRTSSLLLLVFL